MTTLCMLQGSKRRHPKTLNCQVSSWLARSQACTLGWCVTDVVCGWITVNVVALHVQGWSERHEVPTHSQMASVLVWLMLQCCQLHSFEVDLHIHAIMTNPLLLLLLLLRLQSSSCLASHACWTARSRQRTTQYLTRLTRSPTADMRRGAMRPSAPRASHPQHVSSSDWCIGSMRMLRLLM
jgi:hypothetical protein